MNTPFVNKRQRGTVAEQPAQPVPPSQPADDVACCCSARPVVVVLMPATDDRPRSVELLLCGHHYRVSHDALERAGARVIGITSMADSYLHPIA